MALFPASSQTHEIMIEEEKEIDLTAAMLTDCSAET